MFTVSACVFFGAPAGGRTAGGVVALRGATVRRVAFGGSTGACTVSGNTAGTGGVLYASNSTVTEAATAGGCTISGNRASSSGGFAALVGQSSVASVTLAGQFASNSAGLNGGLLHMEGATCSLLQLGPGDATQHTAGSHGGMVHVTGSRMDQLSVSGARLAGSVAQQSGGCISVTAGTALSTLTVQVRHVCRRRQLLPCCFTVPCMRLVWAITCFNKMNRALLYAVGASHA